MTPNYPLLKETTMNENIDIEPTSTDETFDWSAFGKDVAKESATAFALSAASVAGFLAASYAVGAIAKFRTDRKLKKKLAAQKDANKDA